MLKVMEITATYGGDYARGGEHPHVTNITDVSERAHTANPPLLLLLGKWLTPATFLLEHSALALQDGASPVSTRVSRDPQAVEERNVEEMNNLMCSGSQQLAMRRIHNGRFG